MTEAVQRVLITTPIPTPYQAELFNALAESDRCDLTVVYQMMHHQSRMWTLPELNHKHRLLSDSCAVDIIGRMDSYDLVVFSGYQDKGIRRLIRARAASRRPWCFWGERTGFHLPNWLGYHYRSIIFPELRRHEVPIWAIGSWAVETYQKQYGRERKIFNLPYFSNLDDFLAIERRRAGEAPRRILFSGSLIKRKGVDLLLQAFLIVADKHPGVELHLIGDGPLRGALHRLAAARRDQIYFHGFQQWSELPRFYSQADILCAPSRYDGWGLIVPEALAAGLLTISTRNTGSARDLIGSDVGWLIDSGNVGQLVNALDAALSTCGESRAARIERGRMKASALNVSAGAPRILRAIDDTIVSFRKTSQGPTASHGSSYT